MATRRSVSIQADRVGGLDSADIVINMSGRASEFAFRNFEGHAKIEDWEIEDPYGDSKSIRDL